jgi:hypothetical protein
MGEARERARMTAVIQGEWALVDLADNDMQVGRFLQAMSIQRKRD